MTRTGPIGRIFVAVLFIELIANLDAGILPVCAVGAASPFSCVVSSWRHVRWLFGAVNVARVP